MSTQPLRIFVAGHRGMVGSAVCRALAKRGYANVVTRTHKELDLLDTAAVAAFYAAEKPDVAVICAAPYTFCATCSALSHRLCASS